jgi:hypothetical protein
LSSVAKKNVRPGFVRGGVAWLLNSRLGRRTLTVIAAAAIAIVGSRLLWQKVQSHVASQPEYLVAIDDVEITPPPSWIHTDIKADVIRDAGLKKKISILDSHAAVRLSEAFALNPWVARVAAVHTSYPAHIRIDLVYRRPVAMVEVAGGLLPIDVHGILLPTTGFSAAEAHDYPRIAGVTSSPRGLIGTPWGDVGVEHAAKLAELLADVWQALKLHQVQFQSATETDNPGSVALQLVTQGGTVFLWGSAPGEESADEAKAVDKLARLQKMLADFQTLDAVPAKQRDLRRRSS